MNKLDNTNIVINKNLSDINNKYILNKVFQNIANIINKDKLQLPSKFNIKYMMNNLINKLNQIFIDLDSNKKILNLDSNSYNNLQNDYIEQYLYEYLIKKRKNYNHKYELQKSLAILILKYIKNYPKSILDNNNIIIAVHIFDYLLYENQYVKQEDENIIYSKILNLLE